MAPKNKGKGKDAAGDAKDAGGGGKGKLKPATSINVRHILCEKHSKKEEALEKIRNGAKFDEVAREMSEDKARQGECAVLIAQVNGERWVWGWVWAARKDDGGCWALEVLVEAILRILAGPKARKPKSCLETHSSLSLHGRIAPKCSRTQSNANEISRRLIGLESARQPYARLRKGRIRTRTQHDRCAQDRGSEDIRGLSYHHD